MERVLRRESDYTANANSTIAEMGKILCLKYNKGIKEETIRLVLIHMENTHRLRSFKVEMTDQTIDCVKILNSNSKDEIELKEKAILLLKLNIDNLDKKLQKIEKTENSLYLSVKKMLRNKRKEVAKSLLIRKKNYSKHYEKYAILKYELENELLQLETLEANENLFNAIKLSEEAHKSIHLDLKKIEEVFENLKEEKEKEEEVEGLISQFSDKQQFYVIKQE
jgi:hypothetical protein